MILRIWAATLALLLVCGAGVAADKKPTDAAIDDNVRIKLAADAEVNGGALKVEVKDGVVTLNGSLETQRQKDKATKIAKRVKGVKQVVNNIILKEKTAGR
jgi:hyperosmotically inducible periplasmic protein